VRVLLLHAPRVPRGLEARHGRCALRKHEHHVGYCFGDGQATVLCPIPVQHSVRVLFFIDDLSVYLSISVIYMVFRFCSGRG
jgi:hypothetical protein